MKNICFSKKKPYFCILNNIKIKKYGETTSKSD